MKRILTLLFVVSAFFTIQAQSNVKLIVEKATKAPSVDGIIDGDDPWGNTWVAVGVEKPSSTTHAMSAQFQILWNVINGDSAIYIAVKVHDATPHNEDNIALVHEKDCVELMFSMGDTTTRGVPDYQIHNGDGQIRCQRANLDNDFLTGTNEGTPFDSMFTSKRFEYASISNATDYTQEFILPLNILRGSGKFDGSNFRMEIAVADNTDGKDGTGATGRTQQMFWNKGTDTQWNNTNDMGVVHLHVQSDAVLTASKTTASAFVKNDVLQVNNVDGLVCIYNVSGIRVRQQVIRNSGTINIAELTSGVYIVKSKELSLKIVK